MERGDAAVQRAGGKMTNVIMYGIILVLIVAILWNLCVVVFKRKDDNAKDRRS